MKKFPILLLIFSVLIPLATRAQFILTTNGNAITITGYNGHGGPTVIPAMTNNLTVTAIGPGAFQNTAITSVSIPGTVTNIGSNAFFFSTQLTSATMSNGVLNIGGGAFAACVTLTSVSIPNSVTNIDTYAFQQTHLSSVALPQNLATIGVAPFENCSLLKTITISSQNPNFSTADNVLFDKNQTVLLQYPCGAANNYIVPDTVTNIAQEAFDSALLKSAVLPDTVTSIATAAFEQAYEMTNITLPSGLTSIESNTFNGCYYLDNLIIPETVTNIGDSAFLSCETLSYVDIPGSVRNVGPAAFEDCEGLTTLGLENGITNLGDAAFEGCISLFSVQLPRTLTRVGLQMFANCASLTRVTLPNTITSIDAQAFMSCTALTQITLPATVTNLDDFSFESCTTLTNVFYKGNRPSTGSSVFAFDNHETNYYLPGTIGWSSTFAFRPAVLWNPVIQTTRPNFGTTLNPTVFGFDITGNPGIPVYVESLGKFSGANERQTRMFYLTNGLYHYADSISPITPFARYYRLILP